MVARQRGLRRLGHPELAPVRHGSAGADARRVVPLFPFPRSELGLPLDRLGPGSRIRRTEAAVHGGGRPRPESVQEARRQAADVHRVGRPGRTAAGHGGLLRGRCQGHGRA